MRITFISDTHSLHDQLELPGGDVLIHCGDFMNLGNRDFEAERFLEWFNGQDQYRVKIFIAGNHDRLFESDPEWRDELLEQYDNITYLQDSMLVLGPEITQGRPIRVWGSPWQPEFYNWAFNLPRGGKELKERWYEIPENTDILITHGPPYGTLDLTIEGARVGCEMLESRLRNGGRPRIHAFGHIHESYGAQGYGKISINASSVNRYYQLVNKPITVDWHLETNSIEYV